MLTIIGAKEMWFKGVLPELGLTVAMGIRRYPGSCFDRYTSPDTGTLNDMETSLIAGRADANQAFQIRRHSYWSQYGGAEN